MKRMSVLIALLAGMALAVPTINDPGLVPQDNAWFPTEVNSLTDDVVAPTGSSRIVENGEIDWTAVGEGPGGTMPMYDDPTIRVTPFMDWGNDVLVDELNENPTLGKLATDVQADGTIWVAILDPDNGTANDTVWHYYSTDGGQNWTYWNHVGGPSGDIRDFDLRVGSHGGNTYVYTFVVYDGTAGVYVRRMQPGGSAAWTQIAPGDSWAEVAADRNIENPQHLFCGYASQNGALKLVSSADGGVTFGNLRNVANAIRQPAVCAGGAGYVYITYLYRTDSVRYQVGRYTNNLISPTFVFNHVDSDPNHRFEDISIAAARTSPGTSQTAIILNTYRRVDNGNHGPRYSWTTDGGQTWSASFWPPQQSFDRSTWLARYPNIRCSYGSTAIFRGLCVFPETTTTWDSVCYAFARASSPTTWESRAVPNDYRATGEFGPVVDYSSDLSGGYVIYRQFASRNIWVDGWDWTGVEENGQPAQPANLHTATFLARDGAVSLSLPAAARVRAVLYDGAGRRVRELFSGSLDAGQHRLPVGELSRGLYFIQLDINGSTSTAKLVNVN